MDATDRGPKVSVSAAQFFCLLEHESGHFLKQSDDKSQRRKEIFRGAFEIADELNIKDLLLTTVFPDLGPGDLGLEVPNNLPEVGQQCRKRKLYTPPQQRCKEEIDDEIQFLGLELNKRCEQVNSNEKAAALANQNANDVQNLWDKNEAFELASENHNKATTTAQQLVGNHDKFASEQSQEVGYQSRTSSTVSCSNSQGYPFIPTNQSSFKIQVTYVKGISSSSAT